MTTLKSNDDVQRERIMAELLLGRMKDHIADVSRAINKTFFAGVERNMGHIFLSNAAVARRGNLTEKMLFHDDITHLPLANSNNHNHNNNNNSVSTLTEEQEHHHITIENDRWIRGVLIVSSSLLPPPESLFSNRQANGRVLFDRTPKMMFMLLLRVVGVSLPSFKPHGINNESVESLEKCREVLQETEHRFLHSLEACILWLLHHRHNEKKRRVCKLQHEETTNTSHQQSGNYSSFPFSTSCSSGNNNNSNSNNGSSCCSASFFSDEPPTLSVPLYYLSVYIEDNASSRLADIVDITSGFIDMMIDGEMSLVKESTALLQGILQFSHAMAGLTEEEEEGEKEKEKEKEEVESKENDKKKNEKNEEEMDELLYKLHCSVLSLLDKTCCHYHHLSALKGNKTTIAPIINIESHTDCIPISELQMDDSPIELGVIQHPNVINDNDDNDKGNNMSVSCASCGSEGSEDSANMNNDNKNKNNNNNNSISSYSDKNIIRSHPLPGVLVHCVKGVSRSPSVIMAYYLRKCCAEFYKLSRIYQPFLVGNDGIEFLSLLDEECTLFSFSKLLRCLREVRPVVDPQICFLVELKSMWNRLSESMAREEEEEKLL